MMQKENIKTKKNISVNPIDLLNIKDDPAEARTVASRKRLRDQLQEEMQRFLQTGGKIVAVSANASGEFH